MKKTLLLSAALFALAAGANAEVTWEGDVDLAGWGGLAEVPASAFANAKEGTVVRIKLGNITATEESPVQVQLALKTVEDFTWTQIVDCADVVGVDYYDYTVTDAVVGDTDETDLEMLKANGLNIKGQNAHVVAIELDGTGSGDTPVTPPAEETGVWEGDADLAGWSGIAEIPASAFEKAVEGTVVRIGLGNITATQDSPVQLQLALKTVETFAWTQIVDSADVIGADYFDYTITNAVIGDTDETDLEMLKANGLSIKGQNAHVVKISLLGNGAGAVENVEAVDFNAPVEYYTLDGRRVNSADKGLYIVRQGKKVAKVIL